MSWFFGSSRARPSYRRVRTQRLVVRRRYVAFRGRALWSRARRTLALTICGGAAAAFLWGAHFGWTQAPFLKVRGVGLEGDGGSVSVEEIPIRPGDHLFGLSERRLNRLARERWPQVLRAEIDRSLWRGQVTVRLVLRRPLGRVRRGGDWAAVDGTGRLFPPLETAGTLPEMEPAVIEDAGILAILSELGAVGPDWWGGLTRIGRSPAGMIRFTLSDRTEVVWGFPEPGATAAKARRLGRVLSDRSLAPKGFEYARFVDENRIVAKRR